LTDGTFADRYRRQVMLIHITAFYLMPTNVSISFSFEHEIKVFEFFQQYTNSFTEYKQIREEFLHFHGHLSPFTSTRPC